MHSSSVIRHSSFPPRRADGSLMAIALLIMIVTGLFISATATLMSNRAMQASYLEDSVDRRIGLENSRYFHQQFMLERMFADSSTISPGTSGAFDTGTGGFTTSSGWSNLDAFASNLTPANLGTVFPYNYAGFRPAVPYLATTSTSRPSSLGGTTGPFVDDFTAYSFIKTHSPCLGGDPLIVYRRPDAAAADDKQIEIGDPPGRLGIRVEGRAVIRDPESFFAAGTPGPLELYIRAERLHVEKYSVRTRVFCKDTLTGADLPPSTMPPVKVSTGPTPSGSTTTDLFRGDLNVIDNPSHPDNSLYAFMDREQTAGRANYTTISSGDPVGTTSDPFRIENQTNPEYPPPRWPSGYPPIWKVLYINLAHADLTNLRILGVVNQVVLVGQAGGIPYSAAATLAPRIITIVPNGPMGGNVQDLRLINENNRRIVLGVQDWNRSPLDVYTGGTSVTNTINWRMILINEYRAVTMNLPSSILKSIKITGGVMTNWSFMRRGSGQPTRLVLAPDYNPQPPGAAGPDFATLLPREGWIETYFLPTPPSS